MRHDSTIRALRIAEAIESLELYCIIGDQRTPKIDCRIWDAVKMLSPESAECFVKEFNQATKTLRETWKKRFEDEAQGLFGMTRSKNP